MAALVAAVVLIAFFLGFKFYARFLGERIYEDQEDIVTPAHEFRDDRDFVPTNKHVLFGHHFTSIAGAAPIIGPCIAVYWGWVPALLWCVLGTIFMGAMHDFGALVASLREKGRSIADIAGGVVNGRVRLMFMCFVLVLTWLVLAVFAMAVAGLFMKQPSTVLPINIEIVVAIVIGVMIHKRGVPPLVPSLVALGILYLFVWIGTFVPIDVEDLTGMTAEQTQTSWIVGLFVYSAIASLLPVWLLLQPRDFINSHQLIVGLSLLYIGLFIAHPDFDAPAFRTTTDGAPPIIPMLFVTIACGAISGFHGLVSSGTTSKQVASMRDARAVGYGGMLGEGTLAVATVMAAAAGIAMFTGDCSLTSQGDVPAGRLGWSLYYDSWKSAGQNKAQAFVLGGGALIHELGLPTKLAMTLMGVLVISFAATTLDTATRIQRFIVAEIGAAIGIRTLTNRFVATAIAVIPGILLALVEVPNPAAPETTIKAGWVLWPIFGASNQMLAALTLLVLSLYFWQRKRPVLPLLIPMLFVTGIALIALVLKLQEFLGAENWFLVGVTAILLALILWMIAEGAGAVVRIRRAAQSG